jgi:hypothetical protein
MDSATTLDTHTLHINEPEQEEEQIQSITQYLVGREGGAGDQQLQQGMAARRSRSCSRGWRPGGAGVVAEQELQQKLRQRGDDRRPMLGGATQ